MKKQIIMMLSLVALLIAGACGEKQKPSARINVWGDDSDTTSVVELSSQKLRVPFHRNESDLAEVQIELNGEPFNMWWDTGASMTCISLLEAKKLAKAGKISSDDELEPLFAKIADGSMTVSPVVNISEIYIRALDNQYLILHDVAAAISLNEEAPLLIGQNIIQNLPKHVFNEDEGVIEFEKQ